MLLSALETLWTTYVAKETTAADLFTMRPPVSVVESRTCGHWGAKSFSWTSVPGKLKKSVMRVVVEAFRANIWGLEDGKRQVKLVLARLSMLNNY